jgi:hypothetical protein
VALVAVATVAAFLAHPVVVSPVLQAVLAGRVRVAVPASLEPQVGLAVVSLVPRVESAVASPVLLAAVSPVVAACPDWVVDDVVAVARMMVPVAVAFPVGAVSPAAVASPALRAVVSLVVPGEWAVEIPVAQWGPSAR